MLHPQRLSVTAPVHVDYWQQGTGSKVDTEVVKQSRVLIVDHHSVFRRVIREVLDSHPELKVVGEAVSGEQALALAYELCPDIVVLDPRLPDMNGVGVTQQLVTALPGVRVIILTLATTDQMIVESIRAGAFGYLSKDIQPEALARAVVGVAEGEVAMSRRTAARVMAYFRQSHQIEPSPTVELTTREAEVLRLLAEGATDRQIADNLIIAESTAKKHVQHILRKLRARNRAEAVAKFQRLEQ